MGGLVEGNETYIRKFRVTSNERDVLSLRLRVDRVLGSAHLQPKGLPRSAVVCIRHLRVSGGVPFDLTDTRLAAAWQAAVAGSIEQLVMRAARPALAVVPLDAPAVVFLDRAELLACIASDWCDGLLLTRWWWQGLLRNDFAAKVVKDSWKAAPEYAPAALAHLARKEKAASFLQSWSDTESLGLLQDVIKSFALHELMPVVAFVQDASGDGEPSIRSTSPPPWKRWVPESDAAGLEVGQQLLLSICLMLRRAPAIVRTTDFAREIRNWYRHAPETPVSKIGEHRTTREDQPTANSTVIARPHDKVDSAVDVRISARDLDKDSKVPELQVQRSVIAHSGFETPQLSDSANAESRPSLPGMANYFAEKKNYFAEKEDYFARKPDATKPNEVGVRAQPTPIKESNNTTTQIKGSNNTVMFDQEPNSLTEGSTVNEESALRAAPDTVANESFTNREQIETQFGGLFYLVNLGLYLNLYGDFTTPATPGIELNIWDFVALVGEELTGSNDDPIWEFLAHLAGREPEQAPGERFEPDDSWRVPPEWLTYFSSSQPWQWSASDGRLRLSHPEGFLVLDVPLDSSAPADQLRAEIEEYESVLPGTLNLELSSAAIFNRNSETVTRYASPEVRAWLSRLMPYIGARLRAAMATEDDLASLVCRRFARVDATDTHVDVFFGLADLPLEIRLAGLDRDPGWVPAAGRFIAFHFD
jgi:hypothetical protein